MVKSIIGIAYDCSNASKLADFYVAITGWEKEFATDEWAGIRTPHGILLVFQTVKDYQAPTWPWEDDKPQQQAHIDFYVDDLDEAVELAIRHGAKKASTQYFDTSTVMIDPEGHPFCLSTVDQ